MEQEPLVSILVPVYNAEAVLPRCVDSILRQEYPHFELILCDDGSQDTSPALCDAYALQDSRVRVLHRENAGVSATRNAGMALARGKYLQFVDSDDYLSPEATKLLVRAAEEYRCDLVLCDFYRVVGKRLAVKGDIEENRVLSLEEFADHMVDDPADYYYGVLWNKLYRRDIVERHHLTMNEQLNWCEDFLFNLEYLRHAQRIYALQVPLYYYVKTKGSLVNQKISLSRTVKMKLTTFAYYQKLYQEILSDEEYEERKPQIYKFLIDAAGDGLVLPGSKKVGKERSSVAAAAFSECPDLAHLYWERKLLDTYLETAALKHDLTLNEVKVLLTLRLSAPLPRHRELADAAGLSLSSLMTALRRLESRELLETERVSTAASKEGRSLRVVFLPAAEPVCRDLDTARQDFEAVKLLGLSPEEAETYRRLLDNINENARRRLLP